MSGKFFSLVPLTDFLLISSILMKFTVLPRSKQFPLNHIPQDIPEIDYTMDKNVNKNKTFAPND